MYLSDWKNQFIWFKQIFLWSWKCICNCILSGWQNHLVNLTSPPLFSSVFLRFVMCISLTIRNVFLGLWEMYFSDSDEVFATASWVAETALSSILLIWLTPSTQILLLQIKFNAVYDDDILHSHILNVNMILSHQRMHPITNNLLLNHAAKCFSVKIQWIYSCTQFPIWHLPCNNLRRILVQSFSASLQCKQSCTRFHIKPLP